METLVIIVFCVVSFLMGIAWGTAYADRRNIQAMINVYKKHKPKK